MADLSPNLSVYSALSRPQGGPANMDIGSLLGLIQHSRELQTQQAVSDALRQSGGDVDQATQMLLRPGSPGFITPQYLSEAAHASAAVTATKMDQLRKTADFVAYHADDPDLDDNKVHDLVTTAVHGGGVPAEQGQAFLSSLPIPTGNKAADRRALQKRLVEWQSTLTGGQPPAGTAVAGEAGTEIPASPTEAALARRGFAVPGVNAPSELSSGGAILGPTGRTMTSAPAGSTAAYEASATNAGHLQDRAPSISTQRNLLNQMTSLVSGAETGGNLSTLRMHVNQTLSGLGLPPIDTDEKLTRTELFNKFSYQLQQQQAGAWPTEKNLSSVFSANPSLQLSNLGNRGVLAFLQGNLDTENLVLQEWNKWKAAHGGGQELNGHFRDWLNDTLRPAYGRGFNSNPVQPIGTGGLRNFDPRVLQFEHLNPDEKSQFVADMGDDEKAVFARNLNRYKKLDYLESALR